ncbi:kinase-like domain-containing protein [Rhizoctonia solani]|nr:kinase-like domain-containing protein [Rhizoctonia solani]
MREPFRGHNNAVRSVCFSPKSSQIVSGSSGNEIRLWDVRSGKPASKLYEGHAGLVCSVSFSPNGLFVASGSYDRTIRVWDIRTGGVAINPFEGHTGYVLSVAFSPSGERIVSGSNDGTVMVWNIHGLDTADGPEAPVSDGDHDGRDPPKGENTQRVTRHMSFKEMFDLLLGHGCVDLSSKIDSVQNSSSPVSVGGFGEIWTSRLYDGTKVAIKVWRASEIEQCKDRALKRAAREVYYWSRMNHPHVHRLRGVMIFKENCLGMVSEWMENGNLHEYIRKNYHLDRYEMCESIASGLNYMHRDNAIHGDLKAINVLVSSDGIAKLADFGLSTMSEASLGFSETSNPRIGTTRWAAPELVLGDAPKSKESDVYALGMTMLEIITGEVPYPQCHSDYQVIAKIMRGTQPERPMVQLKDNGRDNQMWSLLVSCWNQEPIARPSAQQVLESVRQAFLDGLRSLSLIIFKPLRADKSDTRFSRMNSL